MNRIDMA